MYTERVPFTSLSAFGRVVSLVRVDAVVSAAELESAGARCLQASTDDVLGLGADLRVREAAIGAIRKFGLDPGAHNRLREELESKLARALGVEAAALLPELSVVTALSPHLAAEPRTAHRLGLTPAEVISVDRISSNPRPGRLLLTDAVHPLEGDLAPLPRLVEQAQREQASIATVEPFGFGVLGATGAGAAEHLGVAGGIDLQFVGLSSLGAGGGWVAAGHKALVDSLAPFFGAPPVPSLAAALRSLDILQGEPQRRARTFDLAQHLVNALRERGFDTGPAVTPWVPVWVGDEALADQWLRASLDAGLAVRALMAGPRSRRLFSVPATMTDAQLQSLLDAVDRVTRKVPLPDSTTPRAPVTVSRPGSFIMNAPCGDRWAELDSTNLEAESPSEPTTARTLSDRVFDAVETLTWRAANLRSTRLPGTEALRALFDRTRTPRR